MSEDFDLLLRGARVVDPSTGFDGIADVAIAGSEIADVAGDIDPARAVRTVDASGKVLLPGLVDSHVHIEDLTGSGTPSSAHHALAVAGVTTAVDLANFRSVVEHWHASSAGLTVLGVQGLPAHTGHVSRATVAADIDDALALGAIGVKLLGGHYPSTPDASAAAIEEAAARRCHVAFHAGTTAHGSDLAGMREAVELAAGHGLHLAHTNAYLRGAVEDVRDENAAALDLLRRHPNVVSESHLAPLNACYGTLVDGAFEDHVTRNCLRLRGYAVDGSGLRDAFLDGFAHVHLDQSGTTASGEDAYARWLEDHTVLLSFAVNLRLTAFQQACARVTPDGDLAFEGPGDFVVDAIASDGGTWRNVMLEQGLLLVGLGALSWLELARKTSLNPARFFGLDRKGRISPGTDADVVLVDPGTRSAALTVALGRVIAEGGDAVGEGGLVLTTERGTAALAERGLPHAVVDLDRGVLRSGGSAALATYAGRVG